MNAAALVQAAQARMAELTLRTALLSAEGAGFALGPLHGLGTLFARAHLYFRRRDARPGGPSAAGISAAWSADPPTATIH